MTREEAIAELSVILERLSHPEDCENGCYSFRDGDYLEALDMAIEALQREDEFLKSLESNEPLYDMVDVVRCKDCRYYECSGLPCPLDVCESLGDDGFCSCGERKGGDDE